MTTVADIGIAAQRGACVLFPILLACALAFAAPQSSRVRGAALLATLWNLIGLIAVNAVAVQAGWWSFGTAGLEWNGVPVDVVLGWAVLWGAVPALLGNWVNPVLVAAALVAADLIAMNALDPLVTLAPTWYRGEAAAVLLCLVPSLVLAILTVRNRLPAVRAGMQSVLFAGLVLFAVPTVAFAAAGSSWNQQAENLGGPADLVLLQLAVLVGIVALRAVSDFVRHGGTPFPWDPPTKLVTGGPYAYLANPMQVSMVALLLLGAAAFQSWALLGTAVTAAAFAACVATFSEDAHLRSRFGSRWIEYRHQVRNWIPRWRPSALPEATLFIARDCEPCSQVEAWFRARAVASITLDAAENHSDTLSRIRYESVDGVVADGTRAVGHALEHLDFRWAVTGWAMRAPLCAWFVQLLADAFGAGPRTVE